MLWYEQIFCSDKQHTWVFFSLCFTALVDQALAGVTIPSAKKCCFPKFFGKNLLEICFSAPAQFRNSPQRKKKKKPDKSMWEETISDLILHFLHGEFQSLSSTTNKTGQDHLGGTKVNKNSQTPISDFFFYSRRNRWYKFEILLKSFASSHNISGVKESFE